MRAGLLDDLLGRLTTDNDQGELYLTDIVAHAAADGRRIASLEVADPEEVSGVNTRHELAAMEAKRRQNTVERLMDAGVTFEDPATAYLGDDVEIGPDTIIGPNVTMRGRCRIGSGCRFDGTTHLTDAVIGDGVHVRFGCVVEDADVGNDAIIGPYARLRPGTKLAARVHIGNFVETKKAVLGEGAKANHLTYLGDCEIGPETNVGAGTITCNYDGFEKHKTTIGAAFPTLHQVRRNGRQVAVPAFPPTRTKTAGVRASARNHRRAPTQTGCRSSSAFRRPTYWHQGVAAGRPDMHSVRSSIKSPYGSRMRATISSWHSSEHVATWSINRDQG